MNEPKKVVGDGSLYELFTIVGRDNPRLAAEGAKQFRSMDKGVMTREDIGCTLHELCARALEGDEQALEIFRRHRDQYLAAGVTGEVQS